ncbi:MAG: hypothetical protein IJ769_02645, partial [Clostridia bacterium]|nr:hypothetical protein [Clostridia bacterium]
MMAELLQEMRVGCLMIDDPLSGENLLSGLSLDSSVRVYPFRPRVGERLWDRLQSLLQRARSECGAVAILARGAGCGAALALAEQLPVDRLALV